jgi:hypothetical protein
VKTGTKNSAEFNKRKRNSKPEPEKLEGRTPPRGEVLFTNYLYRKKKKEILRKMISGSYLNYKKRMVNQLLMNCLNFCEFKKLKLEARSQVLNELNVMIVEYNFFNRGI